MRPVAATLLVIVLRLPRLTNQLRLLALIATSTVLAAGCGSSSSQQPMPDRRAPMRTMFESQQQLLTDPARTLDLLQRLGVDDVRVFMPWSSMAPDAKAHTPPAFDANAPAAYPPSAWAPFDAIVTAAASRGIGVDITLEGSAPQWAEGPGQPGGPPGVWEPSAVKYGEFVHAVATRYSGAFTPPGASTPLPRVSFWSIWNEPNYGQQLAPQAIDHSKIEVSPRYYRELVGAAWHSLQTTGHTRDTVLIGELAPRGITTGDQPGNYSGMVPLRFVRALYCVDGSFHPLRGSAATARGCPSTASGSAAFAKDNPGLFNAAGVAVHPYPSGGVPPSMATPGEPDYADLASLGRLESTLDRAQLAYGQDRHLRIYDTEFGYQTDPPETIARAIDPRLAAQYLNWSEYLHWRDPRIVTFDQYLLTDPPAGNFATGLRFSDGSPKALYSAFRLPIFLPRTAASRGESVEVWGCVRPAHYARVQTGRVPSAEIQFRGAADGNFRTLRSVVIDDAYGYFDTQVTLPGSGAVRMAWTYPHGPTIFSRSVPVKVG
jgi:hypothetical protein